MAETEEGQTHELQLYSSEEGLGEILINRDVIARIAGMAALEVEGVSLGSLGSKFTLAAWTDLLPGKDQVKGITVEPDETGRYSITCDVKIVYRTPIRETAQRLQKHIKETVERMASLELKSVDVRIVDILPERKEKEEED